VAWEKRQRRSDSSAERVKAWREKRSEQLCNDTETLPVTLHPAHANATEQARTEQNREEKKETPSIPSRDGSKSEPEGFAEFYAAYPRKVGRGAAERAYAAALRTRKAEPAAIQAGLDAAKRRWNADKTDQHFIPHASTWLNGQRWSDEDTAPARQQPITGGFGFGVLASQ
jgi:hypothetical protein